MHVPVKFWMLCESATGYILQMSVYRGRHFDPVPAGVLQGTRVVVDLKLFIHVRQ
jgi:hypothetical protein